MQVIELDATGWQSADDLNNALKEALGSPRWHGSSPDAWIDSIVYGGINEVEAPYIIRVTGVAACPQTVRDEVELLAILIAEAQGEKKRDHGVDTDVSFDIQP